MSKSETTAAIVMICQQIDLLQIDGNQKEQFKRLLRIAWNEHGFAGFDKVDQLELAGKLLNANKPWTEVRDRLMSACRISRTEAYRVIAKAIEQSQELPDFGTQQVHSSGHEF